MKKLTSLLLVALMLVSVGTVAFAEFVPSINEKPAPELTDDGLDCDHENPIVITPVSDDDASDELKDLYDELKENGTDNLPGGLEDPVVRDLFEVTPDCEHAEEEIENGIDITVDPKLDEDDPFVILGYVKGAWRELPARRNADGTITVTLDFYGPVAILVNGKSTPVTGDPATIALWATLALVSFVMIPSLSVLYLKHNKKAAAEEE
ncbi:MAG: hypothetical protein J6J21_02855 [Clostridia bacterium]|nr:hypothetical protein [Clostridia bacterium]